MATDLGLQSAVTKDDIKQAAKAIYDQLRKELVVELKKSLLDDLRKDLAKELKSHDPIGLRTTMKSLDTSESSELSVVLKVAKSLEDNYTKTMTNAVDQCKKTLEQEVKKIEARSIAQTKSSGAIQYNDLERIIKSIMAAMPTPQVTVQAPDIQPTINVQAPQPRSVEKFFEYDDHNRPYRIFEKSIESKVSED